jgi:hypothetical protein
LLFSYTAGKRHVKDKSSYLKIVWGLVKLLNKEKEFPQRKYNTNHIE